MSQSIVVQFWMPSPPEKPESFAQALSQSGFRTGTSDGPEAVRRIVVGAERLPDRTLWGSFPAAPAGVKIGVTTFDVQGEKGPGSLVRLSVPRSEIAAPEESGQCGDDALVFEAAASRLFETLKAPYGYAAWSEAADSAPLLRANAPDREGRAFELTAVQRGILLELRALNFFSNEFLGRFSKIRDRFARLRVQRIGEYGWMVALSRCLVWDIMVHEDHFSAECGLDLCWKFTNSLDAHLPTCPRANA